MGTEVEFVAELKIIDGNPVEPTVPVWITEVVYDDSAVVERWREVRRGVACDGRLSSV